MAEDGVENSYLAGSEEIRIPFADLVKAVCKKKRITQQRLANTLGISRSKLTMHMSRNQFTLFELKGIIRALHIPGPWWRLEKKYTFTTLGNLEAEAEAESLDEDPPDAELDIVLPPGFLTQYPECADIKHLTEADIKVIKDLWYTYRGLLRETVSDAGRIVASKVFVDIGNLLNANGVVK